MPAGDRTGPRGMGPMTGRAAGYCAGAPTPGFANPAAGRGFGGGFGRGFGFGRGAGFRGGFGWGGAGRAPYVAAPPAMPETDALKNQAQYLEETLAGIKQRLAELEANRATGD